VPDHPVILLDTSGSMAFPESGGQRIDIATEILRLTLNKTPTARVVIFNALPMELVGLGPTIGSLKLPPPDGSTALHLALNLIGKMTPKPTRVVVISDGQPDDGEAALRSGRALAPCAISAFHIGPDNDAVAIAFLRELASAGGVQGVSGVRSLTDPSALADEIVLLLRGPAQ
jgi:Mg-chelatase subunit ChlD